MHEDTMQTKRTRAYIASKSFWFCFSFRMGFRLQRICEASANRSKQIETKLIGETAQSLDSDSLGGPQSSQH